MIFDLIVGTGTTPTPSFDPMTLNPRMLYDPSDLTTMFQDSAGTIPVTADGQPVGKILDKSGNNQHSVQATSAQRPTYRTSGGLHWLDFNGTNSSMSSAALNLTNAWATSIFLGVRKNSDASVGHLLELSASYFNIGAFAVRAPNTAGTYVTTCTGASGSQVQLSAATFTAPTTNVLTSLIDLSGSTALDTINARVDAVRRTITYTGSNSGGGEFRNDILYIGARTNNSFWFNGRIYSMIILDRTATAQEIADTEGYIASKSGVTLP